MAATTERIDPARVRELRDALGLSQQNLAALARVSVGTVHRIEAGRAGKRSRTLTAQAIADALGVELESLFTAHNGDGNGDAPKNARNDAEAPANGASTTEPRPTLASVEGAGSTTGG